MPSNVPDESDQSENDTRTNAGGSSRRTVLKGALASSAFALAPSLSGRAAASASGSGDSSDSGSDDSVSGELVQVEFVDQVSDGTSVVVQRVVLPEGGFVSIHDARFIGDNGEVGIGAASIIGFSEFLEPGEYTDVTVPLFNDEELNLEPYPNRRLGDMQYLIALPHADTNNNEIWEFYPGETEEDVAFTEGNTSEYFPLNRTNDGAVIVSGAISVDEDEEVPLRFES